jgi:uncharacterized SAM-binding protein YcdF (DUF218 family)
MNILIVILGSNVLNLLNDRINLGINFASDERSLKNIDWFLSGGIKNPEERESTASEAYKMSEMISKSDAFTYGISKEKWNYILDETATNTAENFIMLKKMLENNPNKYSEIYVVTSDFHFNRAQLFANKIIENNQFNWLLSDMELHDSRYWETIHIKNVDNDIKKSIKK